MRKLSIIVLLLLFYSVAMAQTEKIKYMYDDAGNRIIRKVIYLLEPDPVFKNDTVNSDEVVKNDTVKEEIMGKTFNIFPNPVNQNLSLTIDNYAGEKASVQLFRTDGSLIWDKEIKQSNTYIYVGDLKPAMYLMRLVVYDKKEKYIREYKIIKQ